MNTEGRDMPVKWPLAADAEELAWQAAHGRIEPCPTCSTRGKRSHCNSCGGTHFRRICRLADCVEYGCSHGFCYVAPSEIPKDSLP